ncbi:EF-hand domain-containing protein [Pseudoruegeria sp. HB172150]|uniref:EF-hand domain-containing protein n=1 Tax=Pseudoruegeria sp. HB172150 TaxID=2721164 RepID=UPI001551E657|nr:EF-hand domain-containing protein [Pseudoruegeria sp. HB172150]
MKSAILSVAVLAATASISSALTLEQIDVNGDGSLTLAELQSVHPGVTDEVFTAADTDADGLINGDELASAQELGLIPADQG